MDLNIYLKNNNMNITEGYSQQVKKQSDFLKNIVKGKNIHNVMEIGFNAGHSAELFLSSNKKINLVSFDIGVHDYVKVGKEFLDKKYPNRHTLILGNSLETVPKYSKENNIKFDIIFIDGGHDYNFAKHDLLNCQKLAHKDTIVILDDTRINHKRHWNHGPSRTWEEAKNDNFIIELGSEDYEEPGRGQSWGKYVL